MKEGIKNKIILVLGLLTIIFFISSINSCHDAARQKKLVNQERRRRMEFEERVLNLSKRNADLGQKVIRLGERLNQREAVCQATQQELNQEILRLKGESEEAY